jgi:hypothetical protein
VAAPRKLSDAQVQTIIDLYTTSRLEVADIASQTGISKSTIYTTLKRNGIRPNRLVSDDLSPAMAPPNLVKMSDLSLLPPALWSELGDKIVQYVFERLAELERENAVLRDELRARRGSALS